MVFYYVLAFHSFIDSQLFEKFSFVRLYLRVRTSNSKAIAVNSSLDNFRFE